MMISGSERLSKTDRYSSGSLFGLFRSVTLRSRSLENVSDRSSKKENDQRRRRRKRGEDEEEGAGGGDGHEYPYAMKMKHLQSNTTLTIDHDDGHLINSSPSTHHSSASLNQISMKSHDFELRKRDFASNEHLAKKLRFFHKRKTKDLLLKSPLQAVSLTDEYFSSRTHRAFFAEPLDQLIKRHDDQLPPVIQQLLEVLYYKGPETIGIFRKVANTRSVKESIEKIERNLPLVDEELHPILAAGIFKHFLRTLPSPIFSAEQYDQWKKCLRLANSKEKVHFARTNIIPSLSESNHLLLKAFICVLNRISQNAETNGMNPFNLGLCVSNSLFKTESTNISSGKQEADVMSSIVEFLILNCSSLFDADVLNCIAEKRLSLRTISHRIAPSASSIESLDEVESSPHLPVVNRSRDSGLATSDQPLNDDSSEVSEHIRRQRPDWSSAVSFGKGTVLTSIFLPSNRGRTMKNLYKPSKQFLEREKFTIDTTDDSDHDRTGDSSVRSSNTTVNNLPIGKLKRSKPICRQSSLGSSEYQQQQQQQSLAQESKRTSSTHHDVKRTSSLKQFHHSSDEGDAGDEQTQTKKKSNCINVKKSETTNLAKSNSIERRGRWNKSKSSRTTEEEAVMTTNRHGSNECQDLDLLHEPLSNVNPRLICSNVSSNRSASFNVSALSTTPLEFYPRPSTSNLWSDGRSRHNGPLAATTNQIYQSPQPLEDLLSSHHRCRPCHRQNALRYKSIDPSPEKSPRYSSVERRSTSRKSASFDIHDELRPTDISWSVKEKAKLFEEHPPVSTRKFSTGRENYV